MNRWLDRHPQSLVLVAVFIGAVLAGSVATNTVVNWRQGNQIKNLIAAGASARHDNRSAIILIARVICAGNKVLENAVLTDGEVRTPEQSRRVRVFFERFNAPVNKALLTLGAPPCKGRKR